MTNLTIVNSVIYTTVKWRATLVRDHFGKAGGRGGHNTGITLHGAKGLASLIALIHITLDTDFTLRRLVFL